MQPKPIGDGHVGAIQPDQSSATATATKACASLPGIAGSRGVVNQSLKSVVREIRTLRSVGTRGG